MARTAEQQVKDELYTNLEQALSAAWQIGRIDGFMQQVEAGEVEPLAGIFQQQIEGLRVWLNAVVDERVQQVAPHEPYMREGVMKPIIAPLVKASKKARARKAVK